MLSTNDIAQALAEDRSKASVMRQVDRMQKEAIDLAVYIQEVPSFDFPIRWYLTWTLSHFTEQNKSLSPEALTKLWELLKTCEHSGMQRDLWRALSFVEIPEDLSAEIFDSALSAMRSPKNAIAVRAHSMFVAFNIAKPYRELRLELAQTLETIEQQNDSAGLYARAKNLRKKLEKLSKP